MKNYQQRPERLVIAEQTNFVEIIQSNGEPPGDFITKLREAAHICYFEELEVGAKSEQYFIQLRLFHQKYKAEILGYLQSKPKAAIIEISLLSRQREKITQFVKSSPNFLKAVVLP